MKEEEGGGDWGGTGGDGRGRGNYIPCVAAPPASTPNPTHLALSNGLDGRFINGDEL